MITPSQPPLQPENPDFYSLCSNTNPPAAEIPSAKESDKRGYESNHQFISTPPESSPPEFCKTDDQTQHLLRAIEKHRTELKAKDDEIAWYRKIISHLSARDDKELLRLIRQLISLSKSPKNDLRGAHFSGGFADTVKGNSRGGTQYNYKPEQIHPHLSATTQKAIIDVAIKGISRNPKLKAQVITALEKDGLKALEKFPDSLYVSILLAAYKGW